MTESKYRTSPFVRATARLNRGGPEPRAVVFAWILLFSTGLPAKETIVKPDATEAVTAAIESFRKSANDVDRARALHSIVKLGADAREAIRSARDKTTSTDEKKFLARAEIKVLAGKVVDLISKQQQSQLIFDGQYSELREEGPEVVEALLHVLNDEEIMNFIRDGAINALADVADSRTLSRIRTLESDPLYPAELRTRLGILMAILGDTRRVDKRLKVLTKEKDHKDTLRALNANLELANVYYKIRNYENAIERYEQIIATFVKIRESLRGNDLTAQQLLATQFSDQQMALQYYNAACSNSLGGRIVESRRLLRKAVSLDAIHFTNVGIDGDLKNLREAEGYEDYRQSLRVLVEEESI